MVIHNADTLLWTPKSKNDRINTKDMFDICLAWLKDNDPVARDIMETKLDYCLSGSRDSSDIIPLTTYPSHIKALVNPGGSEGIYVDWIWHTSGTDMSLYREKQSGTFKTLGEDLEAYRYMGQLSGSLLYVSDLFLWKNYDFLQKVDAEKEEFKSIIPTT